MRRTAPIPVLVTLIGLALSAGPARAAGLLIADGGFGGVLEIQEHVVEVTVSNGIAVTEVNQVFRNTEGRQVEALYTFPVPKAASVANFSMWINGKEMVGEVVEAERARQIYDSYKQKRRDPGLLEQTDFKTFEMRIFPIEAGAEQRVQITYYQELDVDHQWATYVYPLATVSRPGLDARARGRLAFNLDARSEIPIAEMESPSHGAELAVVRHGEGYLQASLEAAGGDLDRDLVVAFKLSRPRTGLDLVPSVEPGEDGYFLLTLTVGDDELAEQDTGMDYVFVLDVSGSMDADGKLSLSRESAGAFIAELGAEDRFEVLCFNVNPMPLFDQLAFAEAQAKEEATSFLDSQRARGGTVLRPALDTAYRYRAEDRTLNVVILSDGMTEQGERAELHRAIAERPPGTRVFAIGIGNEVDRALLEELAEDAGGLAAFVSRGDDFTRQAKAFRRKLLRPAASNLALDFQGGGVYDLEPQTLPDLFHGSPLRLYGRYREGGPLTVRLTATVAGQPIERWLELELPATGADHPEIERMWAWHRIDRLLKQADREGTPGAVRDEVVRLGEAYSIVTEHTSFLVLENDAEYQRWKIDRRNALRIERDRARQSAVRDELAAMRDKARADLGPEPATAGSPGGVDLARPVPQLQQPATAQSQSETSRSSRGTDFDLGGGGAVDGASAAAALGLVLLALLGLGHGRRP